MKVSLQVISIIWIPVHHINLILHFVAIACTNMAPYIIYIITSFISSHACDSESEASHPLRVTLRVSSARQRGDRSARARHPQLLQPRRTHAVCDEYQDEVTVLL